MQVKASNRVGKFFVSDDGAGLSSRAGLGLLACAADRTGLTDGLSAAAGRVASGWRVHDPGQVLRDVVLTLADGGTALRHMSVLDGQPALFGRTASTATACRTIDAVAADEQAMAGISAARAAARAYVWSNGGAPPVVAATTDGEQATEPLVIDVDATLIAAGSDDKDGAGATYKGGWGFQPILACLDRGDGTGEALVGMLRSGNRPAHVAADNITVIDDAIAQLPEIPDGVRLVVRGDSALATHDVVDHLIDVDIGFSLSYDLSDAVRAAIRDVVDDPDAWQPAIRQDGTPRPGAHVVELTDAVELATWPETTRIIVRSEPLHPGAQQSFDDIDGRRFVAMITDQPGDPVTLEARHRARAHIEDRIRVAKTVGLRKLPCDTFERNSLWLQLVLAACDLMTFTQLLGFDGQLKLIEPVTLRHRILHVAARITHRSRQTFVKLDADWPWVDDLLAAFGRIGELPAPAT